MWLEGVLVLVALANWYLWILNQRIDSLPPNVHHKEKWLKDGELLPIAKE